MTLERQNYPVGNNWKELGQAVQITRMPETAKSGYYSTDTVQRPNDTTQYTADDVVGGLYRFNNIGPKGGLIMITDVTLMINVAAVPASMSSFTLHLYHAQPTIVADNAGWSLLAADRDKYLRNITIQTPVDLVATLFIGAAGVNASVRMPANSNMLYGYLTTSGAFTPSAITRKTIELYSVVLNA